MRLKKGTKVEVFVKKDLPCCSWRIGEIVSGNGRYYDIKYDPLGVNGAQDVERVSRKSIRPFPPRVYTFRDWVIGDLVEVFEVDSMCWKVAVVSELVGVNYCLVRLLGSFEEVRAHKSLLRARQIWIHEKWVLVGMVVGVCEDGKSGHKLAGTYGKRNSNSEFQDLHMFSSRIPKKGLAYGLSYLKASKGAGHMLRAIENEGRHRGMDAEFAGCYTGGNCESSDTESSVGSCSVDMKGPYRHRSSAPIDGYDLDSHSSDAESFCGRSYGTKCPASSEVDMQGDL